MQRTIEAPITWLRSKRVSENSLFTRARIKSQVQTLRIFSVGSLGLDEVLTRLPDLFLRKECKTIKSEKKILVGHLPLQIGGTIKAVYLKQHNVLSFGHRLASIFCASAARRSFSGAATLLRGGYATARPIAAVEYRHWGVLIKSLYLSEEISGARTVTTFWREDLIPLKGVKGYAKRRSILRRLARMVKSLHEGRIYHNDLKASNVLVTKTPPEEIFSLIDLQGLRKCFFVSKRRRIKNIAQLNRTLGACLTRTEKLFFVKAYVDYQFSDRRKKKSLVASILEETSRQILREKARHEAAENFHSSTAHSPPATRTVSGESSARPLRDF